MFKKKETKKEEPKSTAVPQIAVAVETLGPAAEPGPIVKTFGVKKFKDGWRSVTVTTQDGVVLETKLGEPDPYAIVLEQFKINFGRYLMDIESEK